MSKKSVDSVDTDDSDPDTVKKPAKEKVQRYQGLNGSTVRRLPMHQKVQSQAYPTIPPGMTEEEYSQAIKSSSNKVLYDLLARNDRDIQELTVKQHKAKLLIWQFYYDTHYDGDYTVNAERMLPYFENLVFLRTSKKFIIPDIGYDGGIEEWIPESPPLEQDLQVLTPDYADAVIARPEELEHEEHEDEHEAVAVAVDEVVDVDMESDETGLVLEGEDFDSGHQQELEHVNGTEAPAEPHMIETEADKMKVFSGLVPDKHGGVAIMVPLSLGTVDNYRKACIYLWKLQNQMITLCPYPAPNPPSDEPLDDAINAYGVRLIYDKATIGTTRNTACNKLLLMATYTWKQQPVHRIKGVRKYKCIARFPHMCERLCILVRHHMLLRDEDIRNLNLSDVFATLNRKKAHGSTWACGLTSCLRRDKTNKKGAMLYATTFRHKDFRRCAVGAIAFYMLERFT
ncbi:hypothetical protein BGX30_000959, partial [Mortierella sp. GBA39]